MRTKTIEIFAFDELDDGAKERAREWWRDCESQHFDADGTIEDVVTVGRILGIEISTHPVKLYGGGTRWEPDIWWSGFASQGDGACFEGSYSYVKGAAKRIREYAPLDTTLHTIADALQQTQRKAVYRLAATVTHFGNYYHEGCTRIEVSDSSDSCRNLPEGAEDKIAESLRDFMRWIYRQLESEYEYVMSDENVDECIRINGYEFDEFGNREKP